MNRWAAGLEYLGTRYAGWQKLSQANTVQQEVEKALSRVADHAVATVAAGRTDSGVHAFQQVIHFDTPSVRSSYGWLLGVNSCLPPDISLRWIQQSTAQFHARYQALERSYRYVIHNHCARSALLLERATFWPQQLDAAAMHRAAQVLVGRHDFSAFRDSQCQSPTAVREMQRLSVQQRGEFIVLDIRGNAFLHHMVRNIAGSLIQVGMGKQPEDWIERVLAQRERKLAGMTAPAAGLYFIGPRYPAEFALPMPPEPWFPV